MDLLDITACTSNQMGGKAENLARIATFGFPIPESRVLLRSALRYFLEHNCLIDQVSNLLVEYKHQDWPSRLDAFSQICTLIKNTLIPKKLRAEVEPVITAWLAHAPAGLAVRSSGICEDMERASFAGIYTSRLGVTSLDDFWMAVRDCWCSTWSPQAAAYAQKMGITMEMDGMAVLIQPTVSARCAGVIFTADPLTGDPWRFVVNAVPGLANRLMDGEVPADRFVLAWDTGEILERHIAHKPTASVFSDGSVVQIPLALTAQNAPALIDEQVAEIGRLAMAVDRAFDRRVDVEWALDGGQVVLLQARPLTALPAYFPHTLTAEQAAETWTPYLNTYGNMNAAERLIAPFYRDRWMVKLWHRFLTPDDIFPRVHFQEMDVNGCRYATKHSWGGAEDSSTRGPTYTEDWLIENEPRLRCDWLAQLARLHQANADTDAAARTAVTAVDWVRLILALYREEYEMQSVGWYAAQWMGLTCDDLLQRFFAEVVPDADIPGLPGSLLQGLSCYSVERSAAAQALGQKESEAVVRSAFAERPLLEVIPALQAELPHCRFLQDFTTFCRHYGMQLPHLNGDKNAQVQDLEGLLLIIKNSLLHQGMRSVLDVLASSARQRQAAEEAVRTYLRAHQPDQLARFDQLLEWAQFWVPALDDRKWHCTMTSRLDILIPQCGEVLVKAGMIEQPDHVKLLTPEEWQAFVEKPDVAQLRSTYQANRHGYERNRRLEPLPYLGKPPQVKETVETHLKAEPQAATVTEMAVVQPNATFTGEGIAPGIARGIACKVSSLEDASYINRLTNETILICATDQVNAQWRRDWYSLFLVVRGLVTVQGATLHHATQIARECGVPFINLPAVDFSVLPEGTEVEIDGLAGTLRIIGARKNFL